MQKPHCLCPISCSICPFWWSSNKTYWSLQSLQKQHQRHLEIHFSYHHVQVEIQAQEWKVKNWYNKPKTEIICAFWYAFLSITLLSTPSAIVHGKAAFPVSKHALYPSGWPPLMNASSFKILPYKSIESNRWPCENRSVIPQLVPVVTVVMQWFCLTPLNNLDSVSYGPWTDGFFKSSTIQ